MNIDSQLEKLNIKPNSTIIVGVSGGPDSMALLYLLQQYCLKHDVHIVAAHVNHNVRKESVAEAQMVQKYCEDNKITFEMMKIENYDGYNFHAEARDKRYAFFERMINKYHASYLMTAHHGDDLIETILMRLIRGSTMLGYSGIEFVSDRGSYKVVRPLLSFSKEELTEFVKANNIPYAIDSSNADDTYLRNRIRNHILPFLHKEDAHIQDKFVKFSNLTSEYASFVSHFADQELKEVYANDVLDIKLFNNEEDLIKKVMLEHILLSLYKDNINLITDNNVLEIEKIINSNKPNLILQLPLNYIVVKEYNKLYIKIDNNDNKDYNYILEKKVELPNGKKIILVDNCDSDTNFVSRFELKDIVMPLHVRKYKKDDIMSVRGLNGRQKANKIFTDAKVSFKDREIYPIVTDNTDKVIWIPGIKKSSICKRKNEKYDIILRYL